MPVATLAGRLTATAVMTTSPSATNEHAFAYREQRDGDQRHGRDDEEYGVERVDEDRQALLHVTGHTHRLRIYSGYVSVNPDDRGQVRGGVA